MPKLKEQVKRFNGEKLHIDKISSFDDLIPVEKELIQTMVSLNSQRTGELHPDESMGTIKISPGELRDSLSFCLKTKEANEILQYHHGLKELSKLPDKIRSFYEIRYGSDFDLKSEFKGLMCKCCENYRSEGHESDCPVKALEEENV